MGLSKTSQASHCVLEIPGLWNMDELIYYTVGETDDSERAASPRVKGLTGREIECLRRCKEGDTNVEIAAVLNISEKTVEFHLTNAMRKLGARNRVAAVVAAIKEGLFLV